MPAVNIKAHLSPELWQLSYLFNLGSRSWLVHSVVVTLVFFAMRDQSSFFTRWYIGMLLVSGIMLFVCFTGMKLDVTTQAGRLRILGGLHTGVVLLVGVGWGAGAIKTAEMSYDLTLFFSLALGGTALGAVSSQSAVLRSCLISIWSSISLLAIAHGFILGEPTGRYSAGLMILFAVILTVLAIRMNAFLLSNHKLQETLAVQVAELEISRKAASDANALKSRFLAHASHDLRHPLHSIGLLSNNLQDEDMSDAAQTIVQKINISVANMSELFRVLLDFSALELGRLTHRESQFDLTVFLEEIAVRNYALAQNADSRIDIVALPLWVETDRTLLSNIIQNLLSNAIKYAPGKPILLAAEMIDKKVAISVQDHGGGILPSDIESVFKEFYRGNTPEVHQAGGLGLGMALVQRFSTILNLECSLQSNRIEGTRVQISGLKVVPAHTEGGLSPRVSNHPLAGLRVHVVDDDHIARAAMIKLLAGWGCHTSGSEQIPDTKQKLDFLITKLEFKNGQTGKQCVEQLRQAEGHLFPAIIITGQQDARLNELGISEPVALLQKPASAQRIRSLMLSQLTKVAAMQTFQEAD